MRPQLIKGDQLTPSQQREVLRADIFAGRWTKENYERAKVWEHSSNIPDLSDVPVSDKQWLSNHAFYILPDGHLAHKPAYCEPAYMADYQNDRRHKDE